MDNEKFITVMLLLLTFFMFLQLMLINGLTDKVQRIKEHVESLRADQVESGTSWRYYEVSL